MYQFGYPQGPYSMAQPQQPQVIIIPAAPQATASPRPPRGGRGRGSDGSPPLNFKQMKKLNKKIKAWIKEETGGDKKPDEKKDEPKKGLKNKHFNMLEVFGLMMVGSLPMGLMFLGAVKAFTLLAKSFF